MGPLRVRVVPLGKGYIAESSAPLITALGSSAEEAAERARLMAIEALQTYGSHSYPDTLIVRIDEPGRSAIAMQSMHAPFSLATEGKEFCSLYFAAGGNDVGPVPP
jgi:hypothetical protein